MTPSGSGRDPEHPHDGPARDRAEAGEATDRTADGGTVEAADEAAVDAADEATTQAADDAAGDPEVSPVPDIRRAERADDRILRLGSGFSRMGGRGTAIVLSLATVALLLVGFLIGFAVRGSGDRSPDSLVSVVPSIDSVEAGFSRDMITHHRQGVTMANYAEAHTDDPEIRGLAFDIASTQLAQIGQMQGWLALWQLPEQISGGSRMDWMLTADGHHGASSPTTPATSAAAADPSRTVENSAVTTVIDTADDTGRKAVMPGMATSGEMNLLKSLRGKESDVYFLQLMVRHHVGGKAMMDYAVDHATNPVVQNFAFQMRETQTSEVAVMTEMLHDRGAEPLPFDDTH